MKKSSLMGASVVAAALLAAAPVVAPVASLATPGTQVVKAADDNMVEVAKKVTGMGTTTTLVNRGENTSVYGSLYDFNARVGSVPTLAGLRTAKTPFSQGETNSNPLFIARDNNNWRIQLSNTMTKRGNNAEHVLWLLRYFFNGQNQINLGTQANYEAAQKMSYTLQFDYSNAIGTYGYPIRDDEDAARVVSDLRNNGGKVTMSLQLYDGNGDSMGDAGLLKSIVQYNVNNNRAAYVNYSDTLNAHVGDSADLYGLSNSFMNANGQIRDYNGNDITMAAYNNGAISVTPLHDINGHLVSQSGNIVDGNFTKPGQYFQRVIVNLHNVLGAQAANWNSDQWLDAVKGGLISVNGQTPSVTNADANVYLATKDARVDGADYVAGDLILKRTVNVDVNQGAFKTDKINGKVTVNMNDGMAAQVYDENGKQVLGRALPNKSAWKTIEKRTYYKDGQVFYQVSTNEYVKAQDVVFTEYSSSSNDNDPLSGKVNVTKYPNKVINILNDGYAAGVYAINEDGQGMHQVIGRFLPSGSAWINQGTAEVNGNLFYQVSTNEWVSSNSVVK